MSHPIVVPSGSSSPPVVVPGEGKDPTVTIPSETRGVPGPTGPAGIILVQHGDDANYPRPDIEEIVLWRGTVQPVNWDTTKDLWLRASPTP